jgi:raffinose/stachyose/melibiose transport system substrate-binding protein
MKKVLALIITSLIVATLFSGFAIKNAGTSTTQSGITGKIVFATQRTDKADSTLRKLADQFMKKYPGTTVEIEGIQDPETLATRAAARELPDVTPIPDTINPKDYHLFLSSIDDLGFNKSNIFFYDNGLGGDGKHYGLSSAKNVAGMIYNKVAFKKAGITRVPRTLTEFYADCEKLKSKGITPVASNFKDKWPMYTYTDVFSISSTADANYMNKLVNKNEIYGNDKGLLLGAQILRTLKDKKYLEHDLMSTNWDGMKRDMAAGKIAMCYLASWFPPQLVENGAKSSDIGMFPFPGTKSIAIMSDFLYGVSRDSQNLNTAKAFLKFMIEDERFAKSTDVTSSLKNAKDNYPGGTELFSFKIPLTEAASLSQKYSVVYKEFQLNYQDFLQEYLIAKDVNSPIKKFNDKWAAARKKVK